MLSFYETVRSEGIATVLSDLLYIFVSLSTITPSSIKRERNLLFIRFYAVNRKLLFTEKGRSICKDYIGFRCRIYGSIGNFVRDDGGKQKSCDDCKTGFDKAREIIFEFAFHENSLEDRLV